MNDYLSDEELNHVLKQEVERLRAKLIIEGKLGGSWNCPKCNFNNAEGWSQCDFCWTEKPKK